MLSLCTRNRRLGASLGGSMNVVRSHRFFSCLRVSSTGGSFFLFTPSSCLCQEQEDVALHLSAAFVLVHSP